MPVHTHTHACTHTHTHTHTHMPVHTHTHACTHAHTHTHTHTHALNIVTQESHWHTLNRVTQRESHWHTLNTVTQRIPLTHWTDWHRENPTDCTHTEHSDTENPTDCTHTDHSDTETESHWHRLNRVTQREPHKQYTHWIQSRRETESHRLYTHLTEPHTDRIPQTVNTLNTVTQRIPNPTDCTHTDPPDCTHTEQSHTERESHWLYRYGATTMGTGLGRRPASAAWFLCVQRGVEGPAIGRGPRGLITRGDTGWTITRCLTSENQSSGPYNTTWGRNDQLLPCFPFHTAVFLCLRSLFVVCLSGVQVKFCTVSILVCVCVWRGGDACLCACLCLCVCVCVWNLNIYIYILPGFNVAS